VSGQTGTDKRGKSRFGSERRLVQQFVNNYAATRCLRGVILLVAMVSVVGSGATGACASTDDFELGLEAARAGQCDKAIELWTKVIRRNPRSYSALVNRGSAFRQSGYIVRAISDWHEARKWSPLFTFGVYSRDYIAQASGDPSMLNFASPLELDPDHVASVLMTGTLLTEVGHSAKAEELYRKSMDLTRNPMLKTYFDHLAESLASFRKR
jgi:tetratricopeptide (TPR) repeat protein